MDKLKRQQAVKKTLDGRQKEVPKEAPKDKPSETEDRTQTVKFCICEVGKSHCPHAYWVYPGRLAKSDKNPNLEG